MHDADDEDHSVLLNHVVHHPVVADPQAVERVLRSLDRLDGLAADSSGGGNIGSQLVERPRDPFFEIGRWLLDSSDRRGRQLNVVRPQRTSLRFVVRPLA